jgi:hypothetical protein
MTDLGKWKGLGELIVDGVEHGSHAVERIQLETAHRPFSLLEQIPVVAPVATAVHVAHTAAVTATHATIRRVTRAVGSLLDVTLSAAEKRTGRARKPTDR